MLDAEFIKIVYIQLFQIEQRIMRTFGGTDEFIKFQLDSFCISILCILNQKKPLRTR